MHPADGITRRKNRALWIAVMAAILSLTPAPSQATDLIVDGFTYNVTGNLTYDQEIIGQNTTGVMNQGSFNNQVKQKLTLGLNGGSTGTYNLTGGNLLVQGAVNIGSAGTWHLHPERRHP